MTMFKKNKKLGLIVLLVFIVTIALAVGLMRKYISNDISIEDFRKEQLVNGRYYYLKTKIVSSSNIEHAFIHNTYKKVHNNKYFRKEDIYEKWKDLQANNHNTIDEYRQNDFRAKTINKNGVLTLDKAFIEGNYFTCIECVDAGLDYFEEEIEGELPIDQEVDGILNGIDIDPWHNSPKKLDVNRLYNLQFNHNYGARKKIFNILKYSWWDDIDFLGKIDWEGKRIYGFRIIDKTLATVYTMYFDIEKIKYVGQERVSKTYVGDGLDCLVLKQKTIVLKEMYSDSNLGVNSDGLSRESEGEINQKLDRECKVDIDCEGIVGYAIKPGTCPAYLNRCVKNQCALMCLDPRQSRNGGCTKVDPETKAFISYICLENEKGVSRLIKEKDSENGICKVSNSKDKTIVFFECIDDEDGKIELLKQLD